MYHFKPIENVNIGHVDGYTIVNVDWNDCLYLQHHPFLPCNHNVDERKIDNFSTQQKSFAREKKKLISHHLSKYMCGLSTKEHTMYSYRAHSHTLANGFKTRTHLHAHAIDRRRSGTFFRLLCICASRSFAQQTRQYAVDSIHHTLLHTHTLCSHNCVFVWASRCSKQNGV